MGTDVETDFEDQPLSPARRALVGAIVGAAGTLGVSFWRGRFGSHGPGATAFWAADRAGHRVLGLDRHGLVCCSAEVTAPVALRAAIGSEKAALVAVSACGSRFDGPRVDVGIAVDGGLVHRGALRMGPDPGEGALRVPEGWRLEGDPGPDGAELPCLVRLIQGRRAFRIQLPFPVGALAQAPDSLWIASARTARVMRLTNSGRVLVDRRITGADGVDAVLPALPIEGGGVWLGAGGAILRLGATGRRLPGQGGLGHVVALLRP